MAPKDKVLWLGDLPAPANVRGAMTGRWDLTPFVPDTESAPGEEATRIAVACPAPGPIDRDRLAQLLDQLDRNVTIAVLLLPADATEAWQQAAGREGKFICLPDAL